MLKIPRWKFLFIIILFYFTAANLAIAYVTYIDGAIYARGGRVGLLACDAALSLVGIAAVSALLLYTRRRGPREGLQPVPP